MGFLQPLLNGFYSLCDMQGCQNVDDLIPMSPVDELYWTGIIPALEGVIMVTVCILDPDIMLFRCDPMVGIEIFYLTIKSSVSNGSGKPASGRRFDWRFGSVRFQTPPKTRPAVVLRGCCPART
jgi:hypothetical protein